MKHGYIEYPNIKAIVRRAERLRRRWIGRLDDADWITINGAHIPLNEEKAVVGGAGGKLFGKTFKYAKSENRKSGLGARKIEDSENGIEAHQEAEELDVLKDVSDEAIKKVFEDFESKYVAEPIEHALVILKNGRQFHCYGTKYQVYPDTDVCGKMGITEEDKMREMLKGAFVTHTHPAAATTFTFSELDVSFFKNWNLAKLRGSDYKYTYELTQTENQPLSIPTIADMANEKDIDHLSMVVRAINEKFGYRRWRNDTRRS